MITTQEAAKAGQALKQNSILRGKLEGVRRNLVGHITNIQCEIQRVDQALRVEYTGWVVLLKRKGVEWECVGVVDGNNLPPDVPEEFDLALPVPKPETVDDFQGW